MLALGDFNDDGNTDIVAGGQNALSLTILSGNGDGTFQSPVTVATPTYPEFIVVADFDGDGKADLALTFSGTNYVYVLLGNGNGTFQTPEGYVAGPAGNWSLASGDVDGDGKLDLIFLELDTNSLSILPGNGDGTFQSPVGYPAGSGIALRYAVVGDFNADGKTDVAAIIGGQVGVLLGGAVPDLSISLAPGPGFTQGQVGATYTITVTNPSTLSSSGAMSVVDALPSGFTATGISGGGWTCILLTLTCTRSDPLAPSGSYPGITITTNISASTNGTAVDSATVSGGNDQNPANNTATSSVFLRALQTVSLTSSPNPSVLGQTVTLTASTNAAATGEVTFYDGVNLLGSAAIAGGQATFATGLLPSGTRNLVAEYNGGSSYGANTSAVVVQTVDPVPDDAAVASHSYGVDMSPQYEAVGDFNRDGKLDLVTANTGMGGAGSVSVLLGNGDGTFQSAINSPAGSNPGIVAVGDFNEDGKPDLVVAAIYGLNILLGNGDGSFRAPVSYGSGQNDFSGLAVVDVNRDGIPDVLAVTSDIGISVFLGKGDGTFSALLTRSFGGLTGWTVADWNGDGIPDLAVASDIYGAGVSVLLGNGDGTFEAPINAPLANANDYPGALASGDFNGDGKPDLAAVYSSGGIAVLLGNGDGTFQAPVKSSVLPVANYVVVGDFNGDGKLDFAYTEYGSLNLTLAFGNGDGTFQQGVMLPTTGTGNIVLGDFNGDGKPDFAISDRSANVVSILSGAQLSGLSIASTHTGPFYAGQSGATYQLTVGNPEFESPSGTVSVTDTLPAGLTATAIGGNGWTCVLRTLTCTRSDALLSGLSYPPIILTVNVSSGILPSTANNLATVSSNSGTGSATDPTAILSASVTSLNVVPGSSSLGQAVSLNATMGSGETGTVLFLDGMNDLGVSTILGGQAHLTTSLLPAGARQLRAFYGGDATHANGFSAPTSFTVTASPAGAFGTVMNNSTGTNPSGIASGDFNNDGKADLVTADSGANSVSILLGKGDGTFRPRADYNAGNKPVSVAVGDFNGDGDQDLAVVNQTADTLSILLGNGDGTFQPAVTVPGPAASNPSTIAVGDFNGDGIEDVVVGGTVGVPLSVFFGNGDGTFQPPVVSNLFNVGTVLLVVDLNGDGKADLLVGNHYFSALLGNGDGTFQLSPWVGYGDGGLAAGDLNGDGKVDVVYPGGGTPADLEVQLGSGDGNFTGSQTYPVSFNPSSMAMADVNGDGNLDVIGFGSANNSLVVMLGNGDGTFQSAIYYNIGVSPTAMIVGEFNGDGRTDLALSESSTSSVGVALAILAPLLGVTSMHGGDFYSGETGAAYTITVTNHGPAPTNGTVSVMDIMPAGLTPTAISGSGWTCVAATLTCTRADPLSPGASYPAITITVNVPVFNTPNHLTNQVTATAGSLEATGSDSTNITQQAPPPAPFFNGQVSLGGGVYYLQFPSSYPFGYYNFQFFPILYHYDMGFEAFIDGGNGAAYFYDFTSGHWWYTSPGLFPYLYDFTLNTWVFYFPDTKNPGHYTTNPRYFSNLATGTIFTM